MDFVEVTKKMWHIYFFGNEEESNWVFDLFDPECVIIGTGKHEFYCNREDFFKTIAVEMAERKDIQFQYKDFWGEAKQITPDSCMVYGGIYIWWESEDKKVYINMDSRFTILYRHTQKGWKIVHVHQSLPSPEQNEGEYYPKMLSEQYREELEKVRQLSKLVERDSLTDLVNYQTFQQLYAAAADKKSWLFIADLDNFKNINDTYGHLEGNRILKEAASVFKTSVRSSDIVCRMGGDEFIFLCIEVGNLQEVKKLLERIKKKMGEIQAGQNQKISCSIGVTAIRKGEALDIAFERADKALYEIKNQRKGDWRVS